jgi:cytochrome c biogenesis factor
MIILIILVLAMLIGIALLWKGGDVSGVIGMVITVIAGMALLIATVSLITDCIEVKSEINKFLATKATIETARETGVGIENTAIQHKIIESNQWLAQKQYYNSTIFGLWIPDEIDNLKPIK